MVMIKCNECNKRMEKLVCCKKCGLPVCYSCRDSTRDLTGHLTSVCKSCNPINADKKLVYEYFKDKYLEKVIPKITSMMFLLSILLLFLLAPHEVSAVKIGNNDNYIKVLPDTAMSPVGLYEQTAWLRSSIDRTVNCAFEFEEPLSDTGIWREVIDTYQSPVYEQNCIEDGLDGNGTIKYVCSNIYVGDESKNRTVQQDLKPLFEHHNLFNKHQYVIPSFTLKAGKEETIKWQYRTKSTGKWDLYCWTGSISDYASPSWSIRLDPFFNNSWNYKMPINIQNDSRLTANTSFPIKIVLTATDINYSLTNDTGQDIRCVNEADTEEVGTFVEVWNETGTSIIYCNYTINVNTNTTGFLYFGNDAATFQTNAYNLTFGSNTRGFWPMNEPTTLDMGDNSFDLVRTAGALYQRNDTEIIERTYGKTWLDGTNDYLLGNGSVDDTVTAGFSASLWFKYDGSIASISNYLLTTRTANGFAIIFNPAYATYGSSIDFFVVGTSVDFYSSGYSNTDWNHVVVRFTGNGGVAEQWLNGNNLSVTVGDNTPDTTYDISSAFNIGQFSAGSYFDGNIDDVRFYDIAITLNTIQLLYSQPLYSFGEQEDNFNEFTVMVAGIMDEDYNILPNSTDEGQEFFIFANFTYELNSTAVYPDAYCNYTANGIIDEQYQTSTGTNLTICDSGCDTTNKTFTFTGFNTGGFIQDIYRFRLCRDTPASDNTFTIANNCSGVYTFNYATIPSCAAGYVNFTLTDGNCSGEPDRNLSIWSSAAAQNKALVIVDSFGGVDMEHNHTANLTWNSTSQLFNTVIIHEYYEHGTQIIDVSCHANTTGISNASVELSIVVVNIPPIIIIENAWWWLLDNFVSFTSNLEGKYPLLSTFNVSGLVIDDDFDTTIYNLNYSNNGTLIHTVSTTEKQSVINYTQNNFSTNFSFLDGLHGYVFQVIANDTTGNVSVLQRSFTAENLAPTASWINVTGGISSTPTTFNWTCTDSEEEVSTAFVFVNGTLNDSGVGLTGFMFNFTGGTYELDVNCEDTFRNGSNDTILVSFFEACMIQLIGVVDGERYSDNTISGSVNCSNSVVVSSCSYEINDFASVSITNCSDFTVSAERGWNSMNFTINAGLLNQGSSLLNFWAKEYDSTVFDYPVLWIMVLVMLFGFALGTRFGVFYLVGGMAGIIVGFQLIAFSVMLGIITACISPLIAIGLLWKY